MGRGRGRGGECFPIPASPTFGDKILSPSPNIPLIPASNETGPRRALSPRVILPSLGQVLFFFPFELVKIIMEK